MPDSSANGADLYKDAQSVLQNRRILVAEDDERIRKVVCMVMEKAGAIPLEARGGKEALSILKRTSQGDTVIEMMFLDLMMPDCNGIQVLRAIRNTDALHALPVVVMSAVKEPRVIQECEQLDAFSYIIKPPTVTQILRIAKKALSTPAETPATEDAGSAEPQAASADDAGSPTQDTAQAEPEAPEAEDAEYPRIFQDFPRERSYALRPAFYRCPFDHTTFTGPRLLGRALKSAVFDPYALHLYGEKGDKEYVEYPMIEMFACPSCLYTCDRSGFYQISRSPQTELATVRRIPLDEWNPVFFELNTRITEAMLNLTPERRQLARRAGDNGKALFRIDTIDPLFPRTFDDAFLSYELAILSMTHLLEFFTEEAEMRVRQKVAGMWLKKAYLYAQYNQYKPYHFSMKEADAHRLECLEAAQTILDSISDIEYRVLLERLHCVMRRFFLADELSTLHTNAVKQEEQEEKRAQALLDMKTVVRDVRANTPRDLPLAERFLGKLESRMAEIEKDAEE